jgi:hypothetical protein
VYLLIQRVFFLIIGTTGSSVTIHSPYPNFEVILSSSAIWSSPIAANPAPPTPKYLARWWRMMRCWMVRLRFRPSLSVVVRGDAEMGPRQDEMGTQKRRKRACLVAGPPYLATKQRNCMHKNIVLFIVAWTIFIPSENPLNEVTDNQPTLQFYRMYSCIIAHESITTKASDGWVTRRSSFNPHRRGIKH